MTSSRRDLIDRDVPPGASGPGDPAAGAPVGPAVGAGAAGRGRRLVAGITTTVLSRATGVVVPLVLIPVTLSYLGADLYGLWMAVTAVTGMVAFADLGLGNGLMTKLAPCYSNGDTGRARRYISSAYLTLTVVAVGVIALLWLVSGVIPWASLLNVTGSATPSDARAMALVCLTAFVANVPLSLVIRVQYAYQQVGRCNVWQSAGNLLALPLALAAVHARLPAVAVVAATVIGPPLANVANSAWLFTRQMPALAPALSQVDRTAARELLRLSGMFLVLTVVTALATNADMLVVAHALGLQDTAAYAVPVKVFAQLGLLATLVNIPLWPAHGDALTQGQIGWVRRTTHRMTLVSVGVVLLASVVLVLASGTIARFTGVPLGDDYWLLVGIALWWVLLAGISPRFMVQNAAGVLRPQLVGWVLYLVVSVPGKWYAARQFGVAAVPYVGVATYLLTVLPSALHGYRRALAMHTPPERTTPVPVLAPPARPSR